MKNYGSTTGDKDIQTRLSVEDIVQGNGAYYSVDSNDTSLLQNIPAGSLILVVSTRQLLTNTAELVQGSSLAEQSDKILVAGGITWESFN